MAFIINHQSEEGGRIRDALKANIDRMTNLLESSHNQMKTKVDENNPQLAEIQSLAQAGIKPHNILNLLTASESMENVKTAF